MDFYKVKWEKIGKICNFKCLLFNVNKNLGNLLIKIYN